jgi:hypothetical protein
LDPLGIGLFVVGFYKLIQFITKEDEQINEVSQTEYDHKNESMNDTITEIPDNPNKWR